MKSQLNFPKRGVVLAALGASHELNANVFHSSHNDEPIFTIRHDFERSQSMPRFQYRPISSARINDARFVNPKIKAEFDEHADKWERATAIFSSPSAIYFNRDYMIIMAKGCENPKAIVPLILNRIASRGGDWFYALEMITGENPAEHCESFADAMTAWKFFAESKGWMGETNALRTTRI